MNGGGFGPRAEVQITKQTDETRRKISIRTAHSWAKGANLQTLAVYLILWLFWWFILMHFSVPRLSGWKTVVFVATTWGRTMAWSWPLWLVLPAAQWIVPLYTLNRHNLKPKVMNDEWPMTHAPLDPNVVGMVGYEALNDIIARGTAAEPIVTIPEIDLSAMVTNGQTSTRTRVRLPVGTVRHWRSFCIAYSRRECRFSGNAAEGFGVDRALFDRVVGRWASPDPLMALIDPASVGPRKTLEPTDKGEGMIAVFASTPLDELSALLAPYETDRQ